MRAHGGEQGHGVGAAGLREAVDGALRLAGLAQRAGEQRLAGGLADAEILQVSKGNADERNDQKEYDEIQQPDELFVFLPAGIGLKRIHTLNPPCLAGFLFLPFHYSTSCEWGKVGGRNRKTKRMWREKGKNVDIRPCKWRIWPNLGEALEEWAEVGV